MSDNMLGTMPWKWLGMWERLDGGNCTKPCPKCGCFTPDANGKYGNLCKVCAKLSATV